MSVKFVSKNSNLHIILRPGIPAQPITGTPATPTLSVRFQDGQAEIRDSSLLQMMRQHPGYDVDFIEISDDAVDPYAAQRDESEPAHSISEIQFGHVVSTKSTKVKPKLPPEIAEMIKAQATEIAKEMLKEALPSAVQAVLEASQKDTAPEKMPTETADQAPIVTSKQAKPTKSGK